MNEIFVDNFAGGGGARKLIEEAPAIDTVPVVRCEKCVYHNTAGVGWQGFGWCHALGASTRDGFFCAFGLEKGNGGED